VGAGLAGLSAALALADAGYRVSLYEAGPAAGGRCRSYFDRELGCRIDNGNHLLLSGNSAAFAWLDRLGTRHTMGGPATPLFPFLDLATGERWTVRPNAGRLPWWVLVPSRRVPGARLREYAALRALLGARPEQTVADLLPSGQLAPRLLEPLAIAALNTQPGEGSARLLAAVVRETLMQGGSACLPRFPREGLSESLVDPALAALQEHGADIQFGRRIAALTLENDRATALATPDGPIPLAADDTLILAVPSPVAATLLPGLTVPDAFEAILNLHYRAEAESGAAGDLAQGAGFIGLIGGTAEWVFAKPGIVSVTISAANHLVDLPAASLAERVWPEAARAFGLSGPLPAYRVVKEKRATFAATPAQDARRPPPATHLRNVLLAGDWTATRLPATIEGAIRSGRTAATVLQSRAVPV
jgi:hydroxysqualene dehydroxylase